MGKKIILIWVTPHEDEKLYPAGNGINLKEIPKKVDNCEDLLKLRELLISAKRSAFPTGTAEDVSSRAAVGTSARGEEPPHGIYDDYVSIYTFEQDPQFWINETHKHPCDDPSKGTHFTSVGRQGNWDMGVWQMKSELARLFN